MPFKFVYAASSAAAVAPRAARFGGRARAGRCAMPTAAVHHAGAAVHSGHDDECGKPCSFGTRAAKRTGMIAVPAVVTYVMKTGMQLARVRTGASAVFTAGAGNGPKKGVKTYDACKGGHCAARANVAAIVTGS
jgi:hypothetical protein